MTIQELLVKDGYWPTTAGPKGHTIKRTPAWITFRMPVPSVSSVWDEIPGSAFSVRYKPEPPTVTCSSTEEGVMT
jgi:hypothetical protein